MSPSEFLRAARLRAGLTQRALAQRAGTSGATVAAYESGAKDPRASTLWRLLRAAEGELSVGSGADGSTRFRDLMCQRWAQVVADDPAVLHRAESALEGMSGGYTDAWRHLLQAGPDAVIVILTSTHPDASALKSDAPFGRMRLIDEDERQSLLRRAYAT